MITTLKKQYIIILSFYLFSYSLTRENQTFYENLPFEAQNNSNTPTLSSYNIGPFIYYAYMTLTYASLQVEDEGSEVTRG